MEAWADYCDGGASDPTWWPSMADGFNPMVEALRARMLLVQARKGDADAFDALREGDADAWSNPRRTIHAP